MIRPGKLNAGSVAYYEQHVERQQVSVGTDMTDYYGEHGDRAPSVLLSARDAQSLDAAGQRLGVQAGQEIDRDVVEGWFNECRSPSGEALGQPYKPPSTRIVVVKDEAGRPVLGDDGQPLTRTEHVGGSVRGWDLMTAAPKSVSMLWGLGDHSTRSAIERAHLAASEASLSYLAHHAGYTRQRMPGFDQPVIVESGALCGVRYQHRTSRAMEPHLHDHVLVHNRVLNSVTGDWTSLDGTSLMFECKTAGTIYQAHLRATLTRELGVSWLEVDPHSGVADLTGLDRATLEAWSSRSSEITAWMDEHGLSGAAADAAAQKETREAKDLTRTDNELRVEWTTRAVNEGIQVGNIGRGPAATRSAMPTSAEVLAEASRTRSTFTRSHVVAATAALLPPDMVEPARLVEVVEAIADRAIGAAVKLEGPAIGGDDVSRRTKDGRLFGTREGSVRYATRETLQLEASATERAGTRVPGFSSDPAKIKPTAGLSLDQAAAMRTLIGSDRQASVLIAPAGAGKTTSLAAARAVWEADGRRVLGVSTTGKAVAGLVDEGACSTGDTIATVLGRVRRGEGPGWRRGDVVLVDEAGMVGSFTLSRLIEQASQAGARLVLIGDPEQLQPVGEAAGLFELLADDLPDTARLGEVWRQSDEDERRATLGLRSDATSTEAAQAVAWYHDHQRVAAGDVATMLDEALAGWQSATDAGQDAIMLAPTWEAAESLAAAAQAHRLSVGLVDHGITVPLGDVDEATGLIRGTGRVAGVGDVVMTRANDYGLKTSTGGVVRNGQTWRVTSISGERVALARTGDREERVVVPADYLATHARLAYGISVHQAQGVTVDAAFSIFDGSTTDQNTAYTAMTRGRHHNAAFIVADLGGGDGGDHGPAPTRFRADPGEAADLLADIIERGRRDRAAHTVLDAEVKAARAHQAGRYDPESIAEFEAAGTFTEATRTALERAQRADRLRGGSGQPRPGQEPGYGR